MKFFFYIAFSSVIFASCQQDSGLATPNNIHTIYLSSFGGIYDGWYTETRNGADSTGVFKFDTSYAYTVTITDNGNNVINIIKGPFEVLNILVDDTDHFSFEVFHKHINGYFIADSVYFASQDLSGDSIDPYHISFAITSLSFAGKKRPK